jgi:hypothetical protein
MKVLYVHFSKTCWYKRYLRNIKLCSLNFCWHHQIDVLEYLIGASIYMLAPILNEHTKDDTQIKSES